MMVHDDRRRGIRREDPASLWDIFDACDRALGGAVVRTWIRGDVARVVGQRNGVQITLSDGVREVQLWASQEVMGKFRYYDNQRKNLPAGWRAGVFKVGDAVIVQASVSVVPGQSQWSLRADLIGRPDGDAACVHGQLYIDFNVLQIEGVIGIGHRLESGKAHDRELTRRPQDPQIGRVLVISSESGDGVIDLKSELRNRKTGKLLMQVDERKARLQGEDAVVQITAAIASADTRTDYIVLTRGGGNLAAFNSLDVARAIHRSRVPVITALGHTANATLADFAAHASFDVPKKAGEALKNVYLAPHWARKKAEEEREQKQREQRRREFKAMQEAKEAQIAGLKMELHEAGRDLQQARDNEQYWWTQANALTPTRRQKVARFLTMVGVVAVAVLLTAVATYAADHADVNHPVLHQNKTVHKGKHNGNRKAGTHKGDKQVTKHANP